jgi:hypothetical protein
VISIPRQLPIPPPPVEHQQVNVDSSVPEKKTRARSKKPSIDSRTNDIQNSTSINNEQIVLDTSNNVEVNSFVSKSNEEIQKNIEKIGDESHLPSVGSSSAKSESIIKEIPLSDEQQRLNQSESKQDSTINITNDDTK